MDAQYGASIYYSTLIPQQLSPKRKTSPRNVTESLPAYLACCYNLMKTIMYMK